jgi:hypothetical protein
MDILELFLTLLTDVSEDIVKDEVAGRLLSKNKSLDKLLQLSRVVGGLSNDLDDNCISGSLRIDIGYADLAVLEIEVLDTFLNSLRVLVPGQGEKRG